MKTHEGVLMDIDPIMERVTVGVELGFGITATVRIHVIDFGAKENPYTEVFVVENTDGTIYIYDDEALTKVLYKGRLVE